MPLFQTKRRKVEEVETTQLKLREGEGRANPRLSTLLSLQTSEPFATPPLPTSPPALFLLHIPFSRKDTCVSTWIRDRPPGNGSAVMVSRETAKGNAPRCIGIQCVTPHFCSQAQAAESSTQRAPSWTCVYLVILGNKWGWCFYLLTCACELYRWMWPCCRLLCRIITTCQ